MKKCPKCGYEEPEKLPVVTDDLNHAITMIIDDLNEVLGKPHGRGFRYTTKITIKNIKARIKEGYKFRDFTAVNRNMFKRWINDDKMSQYLNPETLYGNKFEKYLQMTEPIRISDRKKRMIQNVGDALNEN